MSYQHYERLYDFSGGLNNRDADALLENNESPDLCNVVLGKRGTFETRPGITRFRDTRVDDAIVTSIYEYVNPLGTAYFLAFADEHLKVAIPGDWAILRSGFTPDSYLEFITNSLINMALFVNGEDGYFETDGVTCDPVTPYDPTLEEIIEIGYNALGGYTEHASLQTDLLGDDNDLIFTAQLPGPSGITIAFVDPSANDALLSVSVTGDAITVNLATDGSGNITSTAKDIRIAIHAHATASDMVYVEELGEGVVTAMSATGLTGGDAYTATLTQPHLIEYHKYRTWLANVDGHPDRIYFSVDDIEGNTLYNYFTAFGWLRAANPKGEPITAIISFKERLYIFTRTTIRVITGSDLDDFAMVDFDRSVGAVSSRTVWNTGDHLIFLGVDGVYMFDGVSAPMKVSVRQPESMRNISTAHRHRAAGAIWNGMYFVSVPESTKNDVTLLYDTDIVPLTYIGERHSYANSPWTLHRGYVVNQWLVGRDLNLYFASPDGYVYQYGVGDTDSGETIDAYYTTKLIDLGIPDRKKRIRRLILDASRERESFMRIEYKLDTEDNEWKLFKREIDLSKPIDRMFFTFPDGRGPLCRKIAFKFSTVYSGSKFRVNGFTLDIAVHGHQQERSE